MFGQKFYGNDSRYGLPQPLNQLGGILVGGSVLSGGPVFRQYLTGLLTGEAIAVANPDGRTIDGGNLFVLVDPSSTLTDRGLYSLAGVILPSLAPL